MVSKMMASQSQNTPCPEDFVQIITYMCFFTSKDSKCIAYLKKYIYKKDQIEYKILYILM